MQKFKYVAVNLQKQKFKGTFIAKDEKDLAQELAKQGLFLVSSAPYSDATPSAFFTLGTGKVNFNELTTFCRQFGIMQNTHIPILDCLDILRNQSFSLYFKKILNVVYNDVKGGLLLSEALDKHAKVFPDFFRSMINVGEKSGKLHLVFSSLADYYEKDASLKRKVKSAMSYPTILLLMTIGILVLMFIMVIPTFRDALSKLEVEITGITKIVYDIADFFNESGHLVVLFIMLFGLAIFGILQTEKGKYAFDFLKLKLPMIKTIQTNVISARFARAFSLLLSSGMDLSEALDSIEIILDNRYFKKRFHEAAENIKHGVSITVAFESYKLFPQIMLQMIQIGEKTAELDQVLNRSCGYFDALVETSLNSLVAKIQPTMLLIMGGIIGTLFIAVYSPMLSIMTTLV